jgi:YhcH/YjgK/YiaL family protein
MIIDTLQNAPKYFSAHPLFAKAFEYISQTDIENAADGKADISDGLKAIYSNAPGKTIEVSLAKFECHNKNIDIQLCISGFETIGWKPREKCETPNGDYNAEKDVQFFNDTPDTFFQLRDGTVCDFLSGRCACTNDRRGHNKETSNKGQNMNEWNTYDTDVKDLNG